MPTGAPQIELFVRRSENHGSLSSSPDLVPTFFPRGRVFMGENARCRNCTAYELASKFLPSPWAASAQPEYRALTVNQIGSGSVNGSMEEERYNAELAVGMRVTERGFGIVGEIISPGMSVGEWLIRDRYGNIVVRRAEDLRPWVMEPRGSFRAPSLPEALRQPG
jgi:hypothetical protein